MSHVFCAVSVVLPSEVDLWSGERRQTSEFSKDPIRYNCSLCLLLFHEIRRCILDSPQDARVAVTHAQTPKKRIEMLKTTSQTDNPKAGRFWFNYLITSFGSVLKRVSQTEWVRRVSARLCPPKPSWPSGRYTQVSWETHTQACHGHKVLTMLCIWMASLV